MTNTPLNDREARLLDAMMTDMQSKDAVYRPGVYWESKARVSAQSIKDNGYSNFRSAQSVIGLSYADNPQTYYAPQLSPKRRVIYNFLKALPIINDIIDGQCRMTAQIYQDFQNHQQHIADTSPAAQQLAKTYDLSRSTSFGSGNEVVINGQAIAAHYLELCQQAHEIRSHIDFSKVTSVFEIGGGFGTMAHILLQNFPNIKTYVYLDIPPNLFIGTQYLRSLYPDSVRDYLDLKDQKEIEIKNDNKNGPTIYCICPWQIESLRGTADLFYNSHSFVEMSEGIVANYVKFLEKLSGPQTQYALVTYDGGDGNSITPDRLIEFFSYGTFKKFKKLKLLEPWRHNFYAIGTQSGKAENYVPSAKAAVGE